MTITPESPRHHLDVEVFASPLLRIGRWRCPAEHPVFADSGPVSDTLFVFPRQSVWIQHDGGRPFVADANTVTYYNKGQPYRRQQLSEAGDHCEWFAVAPDAIADTLAAHEPAAIERPDRPFTFTHGPSDPDSYLRQRLVFEHVSRESAPDRLFVEEAVLSVLGTVTKLAYQRQGKAAPRPRRLKSDVDAVEASRDLIARRYRENLSLSDIGREVGASVFHLSRLFHARTGFSLHAYRNQLRLRAALARLGERDADLTGIALDLGFSSHSHFTETFRRTFGRTPSSVRRSL
ncbi:MAG: helix-turn-helix domain-containing protein [Vicinamibacterales bacterium]